jgi:hypothetical protein
MIKLCECGCLTEVKGRFVRGHQFRKKPVDVAPPTITPREPIGFVDTNPYPLARVVADPVPPPLYPLPFDHGKFRVAEEQPGTDLSQPWRLTRCLECREAVWSHNHDPKLMDQMLCESCAWTLVSGMADDRVANENRHRAIPPFNPFE